MYFNQTFVVIFQVTRQVFIELDAYLGVTKKKKKLNTIVTKLHAEFYRENTIKII